MSMRRRLIGPAVLGLLISACTAATADEAPSTTAQSVGGDGSAQSTVTTVEPLAAPINPSLTTTTASPPTTTATTTTLSPFAPPDWLGTRILELRPDGFGVVEPTPPELVDRRFATPQLLPPPGSATFESTVSAVPPDVATRSSWNQECPVGLNDLAYVTLSHIGFDGEAHTGELLVNARVADKIVGVFAELYAAQFPIEEMRVTRADEIDAPPTGDGNVTGSFDCRDAVNSGNWSQHAYGLAIDINPFHNPYVKGDLVIPELASYYLDRELMLPGMVETSVVVAAFANIGWTWGGNWRSLKDWMHFSESGT